MAIKAANRIGRRNPLNLRATDELREKLEAAASASGRSLTQELEARLLQTFKHEDALVERFGSPETVRLVMTLGDAINLVETITRRRWTEDEGTREMVRNAVNSVMDMTRGSKVAPETQTAASRAEILLSIGARYSVSKLAATVASMAAQGKHTPEQMDAVLEAIIAAANAGLLPGRIEAGLAPEPKGGKVPPTDKPKNEDAA